MGKVWSAPQIKEQVTIVAQLSFADGAKGSCDYERIW